MENPTRFDLNCALLAWKAELTRQPGLSAENVRELETHLLESISAFRRSGLNDEEAFSKARQKLGSAEELAAEFAKDNLVRVWRDRVFWMTAIPLLIVSINTATEHLFRELAGWVDNSLGVSRSPIAFALLEALPSLLVATLLASGLFEIIFRRLHWLFVSRWRLASTGVIAILATTLAATYSPELWDTLAATVIFEIGFLGFAVLIRPPELAAASVNDSGLNSWRNSIGLWRERLFWVVLGGMAINVWGLVPAVAAAEINRYEEWRHYLLTPWAGVLYLSVWLLPMAVVGLVLATARLSSMARWLRTRWRAGLFATALVLTWLALVLWLWRRAISPEHVSPADWEFRLQQITLSHLVSCAGVIALMLWSMPSSTTPQTDGQSRDVARFA